MRFPTMWYVQPESLRSACVYAQSDQSLCQSYYRSVNLPTEHHLEFINLTGGCTGLSESTHVKMPHCWKSHVTAHINELGQEKTNKVTVHHEKTQISHGHRLNHYS